MLKICTYYIIYQPSLEIDATSEIETWLNNSFVSYMQLEGKGWPAAVEMEAAELRDHLLPFIQAEDKLLVFGVGPSWSAWILYEHQLHWLKKNWHAGILTSVKS